MSDTVEVHPVISTIEAIVRIFKDFQVLQHEVTRLQDLFSVMSVQNQPSVPQLTVVADPPQQERRAVARQEPLPAPSTKSGIDDLPVYIRELIREKRRARRRAQKTLHPADRKAYNKVSGEVRVAVNEYRKVQVALRDAMDAMHKSTHQSQLQ